MAIRFTKYVDITSGVGGGAGVRERDLILRDFTTNPLLPTGSFIEMSTALDVSNYFGDTSEEAVRANFYFAYISKNTTSPNKISFARWVDADVAPLIFGFSDAYLLTTLQAITAGEMTLTLGGVDNAMTAIDFSGAASLADVATALQTKIQTGTGTVFTAATVSYNATRASFDFVGGDTGIYSIVVTPGVANDVAAAVGWLTGAILSDGAVLESPVTAFNNSIEASDNFGSFLFQDALTIDEITSLAQANAANNVKFMYSIPVIPANASAYNAALLDIGGNTVTISDIAGEYAEMAPCTEMAATDYDRRNSVVNYMFQIYALTASVSDNTNSDLFDGLRINYYGQTQTAGQFIEFYQRGVMNGLPTNPVDQNVYANEVWLKDAAGAVIMSLLLSLGRVSANRTGAAQINTILQGVIQRALFNGTISVGRTLTDVQKVFIDNATGNPDAYRQIEDIGYWVQVTFKPVVTIDGRTEYVATYTLIYAKDDAIRRVEGTHTLI